MIPLLAAALTLHEALRIFRERGFDLLLAQEQVESAQGDLQIAGAIPNPSISGAFGKSQDYGPPAVSLGLSDQGAIFDVLVNKRGLRKDVARAALDAARLSRSDAQRTLEFQLKQQYLQAALAVEQARFARETLAATAQTRDLQQRRFSAGAISEADLARVEVAELEAEQQLDQADAQLAQAKAGVAFLLGMEQVDLDIGALEYRPEPIDNFDDLEKTALQNRPDLQALDRQVQRAESALELAKRQVFPDVQLSANYAREGSGPTAVTPPTVTFGATFPLPIFDQQQGEIRKAESDLRVQSIQREKLKAQVARDVSQAYSAWQGGQKQVERMRNRLLERAKTARDLVQIQYEKGASSLLELLEAERTYIAAHAEYVQDLSLYWTAVAQLEQAVGKELRQ